MRKNIQSVIAAFRAHQSHREATCRTDGETVWSYEMVIAKRANLGTVYIAGRHLAPSRTTRAQIDALRLAFPERVMLETEEGFSGVPQWRFKEVANDQ